MGGETVTQGMTGDFLSDAKLFDHLGHGCLNAAPLNGALRSERIFSAMLAVWKDKMVVTMDRPEPPEQVKGGFGQRNQAVFIALGASDQYPLVIGIDIAHAEVDTLAKPQTHTVNGKKKTRYLITLVAARRALIWL